MQSPPSLVTPPGLPSELKMLEREIFQHIGSLFWSSPIHTSPPSVCLGAAWGWVHDGEAYALLLLGRQVVNSPAQCLIATKCKTQKASTNFIFLRRQMRKFSV